MAIDCRLGGWEEEGGCGNIGGLLLRERALISERLISSTLFNVCAITAGREETAAVALTIGKGVTFVLLDVPEGGAVVTTATGAEDEANGGLSGIVIGVSLEVAGLEWGMGMESGTEV